MINQQLNFRDVKQLNLYIWLDFIGIL